MRQGIEPGRQKKMYSYKELMRFYFAYELEPLRIFTYIGFFNKGRQMLK